MLRSTICIATFFIAGIAVALAAVPIMGIIMAMAIPAEYFAWFKAHATPGAGLFVADIVLIGSTLGLLTSGFLLLLYRFLYPATKTSAFSFLLGLFLTTELAIPVLYGIPVLSYTQLPWHVYAFHMVMVLASLIAYLVARRAGPNNSFKPNPLRRFA